MSRGEEPTPDSGLCEESLSVRVGRAGGWGLNGFGGFPGKYCDPPGLGGRGRLQERRNWGASAGVQVTGDEGLNQEKAVGTGRINKGRRQCHPVSGGETWPCFTAASVQKGRPGLANHRSCNKPKGLFC